MAPSADPAILEALGLDDATTAISSHGGSGFSSTFRITSNADGKEKHYFIKTGSGEASEVMFRGEYASLNAISDAVADFCPRAHAHGPMSQPGSFFLATDFLDLGSLGDGAGSGLSLAAKLARLHTTPAPLLPVRGQDDDDDEQPQPAYGFPVTTCCGETPQDNGFHASWADFYAECRLRAILRRGEARNGRDAELADAVERVAARVVPRLVGDGRVEGMRPVVVHGDLWSGNHGRGSIAGADGVEEVVFDPSAVYGHSEYDLGIMRMFGGFGSYFWDEYTSLVPKAEPTAEWDDRVSLYELYHHLNHWAMFGGGYRGGAMSIMKKLISKYGE